MPTVTQMNNRTLLAADYATDTATDSILEDLTDMADGTTKIQVDVRQFNGADIAGDGSTSDKIRTTNT